MDNGAASTPETMEEARTTVEASLANILKGRLKKIANKKLLGKERMLKNELRFVKPT